jgi:restriction system protein
MAKMWMVRSGEGGVLAEEFLAKGVVAIGWGDTDWTTYPSRDAIFARIAQESPDNTAPQNLVASSQIERFLREIRIDDRVITYDPETRKYSVGIIKGEPQFRPGIAEGLSVCRAVEWQSKVLRDELGITTRNSLGAISTLFRIPDAAAAEIESKLAGHASSPHQLPDAIQDESELLKDIQGKAFEFIKDKVSSLDWDAMQQLVAGLLRAMGYKTRISPTGSDRGKDIVASPDGFGFESPRIVVEVKHRAGSPIGAPEIRSFLGGRHKDDKGLYVSTGGYSKEARYEAERASIPLTLMDLDDLVKALLEHYENLDSETQRLLALRKVYWPA